jgi:hypothetical protein
MPLLAKLVSVFDDAYYKDWAPTGPVFDSLPPVWVDRLFFHSPFTRIPPG